MHICVHRDAFFHKHSDLNFMGTSLCPQQVLFSWNFVVHYGSHLNRCNQKWGWPPLLHYEPSPLVSFILYFTYTNSTWKWYKRLGTYQLIGVVHCSLDPNNEHCHTTHQTLEQTNNFDNQFKHGSLNCASAQFGSKCRHFLFRSHGIQKQNETQNFNNPPVWLKNAGCRLLLFDHRFPRTFHNVNLVWFNILWWNSEHLGSKCVCFEVSTPRHGKNT